MSNKTIKIIFMMLIIGCILGVSNKIYGTTDSLENEENITEVALEILDSKGTCLTIMPPESGGINGCIDSSLDYTNCKYEIIFFDGNSKYDDVFEIEELGTFTKVDENSYIADIKDTSILTTGKFKTIDFEIENLETQQNDKCRAYLLCFKDGFSSNGNLSVNGIDFIKNGEIVLEEDFTVDSYAVYDRVYNTLRLNNYNVNSLKYENMGKDFTISISSCVDGKWIIKEIHPYSGIELNSNNSMNKEDNLVAETITEGDIFEKVTSVLGNEYQNLQVYDISIENIHKEKIQPNGNVEISIPIPNDVDNSKLVVYRVADDGTKTEYKVTVNTLNGTNYATFETDHFSTYVLAEKVSEVKTNEEIKEQQNVQTNEEKNVEQQENLLDNEPKTGIIDIKLFIGIILVISTIVIVKSKRKNG